MKFPKCLFLLPLLITIPAFAEPEAVEEPVYTQAELDQLLAPIALYPDVLLSQVLMASTYPLEVVEASRWSRAHPELEGDDAVQAVQDESWDMSVKALVAFPDLIQRMDENLEWTRQLGDAFLVQEADLMDTTQRLRERALAEGSLDSMEHVTVERRDEQIIIEPADVRVVYVPYYSTRVVYGDWWWHDYPPYYWGPPLGAYSSIGFSWSPGFRVSTHFYYSTCDWPRRSVVIFNPYRGSNRYDFRRDHVLRRYDHYSRIWRHDPVHRKGVRYRHPGLDDRYSRHRPDGAARVRIPYVDRDQRDRRVRVDHRPESVHRGDKFERRATIDRQQRVDRSRADSVDRRVRIDRDRPTERRRPEARPDRSNQRPVRPEARPGRGDSGNRQQLVRRSEPRNPQPPPVPKTTTRTSNSNDSRFANSWKSSRFNRPESSGKSRSIDRREAWNQR